MNVSIGGIAKTVEITSFDKLGDVKVCMLTTTADGSVGFQQLNQEVVDTIYASFPMDTASGDIASFEDGADNVPVRELKLNLEPYQNLNGYGSPWVGGAGKNKMDWHYASSMNITTGGVTQIINSDGSITLSGTNSTASWIYFNYSFANGVGNAQPFAEYAGQQVIASCKNASSNVQLAVGYFRQDGTFATLRTLFNNNDASMTLPNDVFKLRCFVQIPASASVGNVTLYPMLRLSTESDSAWTPYENICPIYPSNGKNLLPKFTSGTASNLTFTVNDDGSVHVTGTNTGTAFYAVQFTLNKGDYILSGAPKDGQLTIRNALGGGAPSAEFSGTFDDYGSEAHFSVSATASAWLNIRTVAGTWDTTYYPMIRHAEVTSPTYVPQDGLGIVRTGKNLLSQNSIFKGVLADANLVVGNNNSTVYRTAIIKLPQGSWTFTFPVNVLLTRLVKDGTYSVISDSNIKTYTINTTTDGWVGLSWRDNTSSSTNWNDSSVTQLEKGSASTVIEPYTAERYYPISDNPVYGGTLEVETGVLTVDRGYVVFDGTGWTMYTSGKFYSATDSLPQGNSGASVSNMFISNLYPFSGNGDSNSSAITTDKHFYAQKSYHRAWVYDSSFTTLESFQAELSANNLQIVYPLATPQTYQLTPVQVKTLLGYNNIWTDSGTVEVQYRANIGLYIQKIIGVTEDDMVANQNIAANQYFFVGEELYYSTSAISAGQTIIVGTNCIKTNLADALNALNS